MAKKSPWTWYGDGKDLDDGSVHLGIDPSLTGFALCAISKKDPKTFLGGVYKSPYRGADRLLDIEMAVDNFTSDFQIADLAIEGTVLRSQSASILGELSGVVKTWLLREHGLRPLQVPPTSLKKYVTGKGTGVQKNQMLLAVYKKWGVTFDDDNVADAYGLARFVAGGHTLAYERETYDKIALDPKFRDQAPAKV
jgi:Holliday junction resolvasome RuvABC endonuclease subunit